jgi:transposase
MTATTTHATAAPATILALDLGKYKSVACLYDRATASGRFDTIATSREHLADLFRRHRPALVVFEACALAGWVHDLCAELGLPCKVANTAAEAWKFKHLKRKTDKDYALRLAQLEALGQLPTVVLPPKQTREWRALIGYRQALVGQRVALQNRIRAVLVGQGLPAPRGHRAWTAVGLVPRQYQSGERDQRGRITKRGPALLRKLLVECGWVMLRYNAWARAVYQRLCRGKTRKKQAIVALARKLVVRLWAMLRDGAPWREDPAAAVLPT